MSKLQVKGVNITLINHNNFDFISLTDMVKSIEGDQLIKNWIKNKNTIEYLGAWEQINNPNFNMVEFHQIKAEAGTNRFLMSVNQWVEKTGAIGITSKTGRYGGTYAHKDLAFEFGTWISPEFKLLLIKEFQRLKDEEIKSKNLEWDYRRFLSKANYKIHTDAIKDNIIPTYDKLSKEQEGFIYADEAEMLNVAMFGITSKQWKKQNPGLVSENLTIRESANIIQLTVLSNLETLNAHLIREKIPAKLRLLKLKEAALSHIQSLSNAHYDYPIESPKLPKGISNNIIKTEKAVDSEVLQKKQEMPLTSNRPSSPFGNLKIKSSFSITDELRKMREELDQEIKEAEGSK